MKKARPAPNPWMRWVPALAGVLLALVPAAALGARPGTPVPTAVLSGALVRFEKEVASGAATLVSLDRERKRLADEVDRRKEESASLQRKLASGSNVLLDLRLKTVLGELRGLLAEQSELESRWDKRRRDFEEKALSLLSLYNDRIEQEIASPEAFLDPSASGKRLDSLVDTARKRSRLQARLERYRDRGREEPLEPWSPDALPPSRDRESLELTLHLLKDRVKMTEGRIERSLLQEEEILKEIRLQERMSEFMWDIERMREQTSPPAGGPRDRDLEWIRGRGKIGPLRARLQEVREQRDRDQTTLVQLEAYLDQTAYRLKNLERKGGMRP